MTRLEWAMGGGLNLSLVTGAVAIMLAIVLVGAMDVEDLDAAGNGTADSPYSGSFTGQVRGGEYFCIGTTVELTIFAGSSAMDPAGVSITLTGAAEGLTYKQNGMYITVTGTMEEAGTLHIDGTSQMGAFLWMTLNIIDPNQPEYSDLSFESDPITDGIITFNPLRTIKTALTA